jgi:hypothetical protein
MKKIIFIIATLALISAGAAANAGNPHSRGNHPIFRSRYDLVKGNVIPAVSKMNPAINNSSLNIMRRRPRDNNR